MSPLYRIRAEERILAQDAGWADYVRAAYAFGCCPACGKVVVHFVGSNETDRCRARTSVSEGLPMEILRQALYTAVLLRRSAFAAIR